MKSLIIALLLSVTSYAQELYQVTTWASAPTNSIERIDGIPLEWPMQVTPVAPNTEIKADIVTKEQIEEAKKRLTPDYAAYEARKAAREATKDVDEKSRKAAVMNLFDDFIAYENGWQQGTNYTTAQLNQIIRKHNRMLIKLRPLVRDLFREE